MIEHALPRPLLGAAERDAQMAENEHLKAILAKALADSNALGEDPLSETRKAIGERVEARQEPS